jgi:hypothetical protein
MIKKWLIRIAIIVGILIFLGILTYGQVFNFVLKPFSEECGVSSGINSEQVCDCDGFSFNENRFGGSTTYCLSDCGDCTCYEFVNDTRNEVACEPVIEK